MAICSYFLSDGAYKQTDRQTNEHYRKKLPPLSRRHPTWFKHILFMMKRIGRGLNATRALSWKEYLQGNSLTHTDIQQHEHTIKIHNIKTCD